MRGADATPEEQELLSILHAQMVLKMRYTQPPVEEAHLYEQGIMDIDRRDGATIYGIPVWFPRAESDAWVETEIFQRGIFASGGFVGFRPFVHGAVVQLIR